MWFRLLFTMFCRFFFLLFSLWTIVSNQVQHFLLPLKPFTHQKSWHPNTEPLTVHSSLKPLVLLTYTRCSRTNLWSCCTQPRFFCFFFFVFLMLCDPWGLLESGEEEKNQWTFATAFHSTVKTRLARELPSVQTGKTKNKQLLCVAAISAAVVKPISLL